MSGRWLDTQITSQVPIPDDIGATGIVGEQTSLYNPYIALNRRNGQPLDNNDALIRILQNTDIDILLRTIGNAFFPRIVTVGTTPTLLIEPNRTPRGYILLNPNTSVSGVVTTVTMLAAGTVLAVGTTNTTSVDVSAHLGARFILNVTEENAGGNTSFNLQTQDPISGNWADAQTDIFQFGGSPVPVGTYYANVGEIGVDNDMRIQAVVGGDTMTVSLAAMLKPGVSGSSSGPTVFIGGPDVNTTIGFPILSGTKETFYLRENTAIYAVAVDPTQLRIFELQ